MSIEVKFTHIILSYGLIICFVSFANDKRIVPYLLYWYVSIYSQTTSRRYLWAHQVVARAAWCGCTATPGQTAWPRGASSRTAPWRRPSSASTVTATPSSSSSPCQVSCHSMVWWCISYSFQCRNRIDAYANRVGSRPVAAWPEIQPVCYLVHDFP